MTMNRQPSIPLTRQRIRSTIFGDLLSGEKHWHGKIGFQNLSEELANRLFAVDLTVHELQKLNIIEDRITNLHLMKLSGEEITSEDVEWPL